MDLRNGNGCSGGGGLANASTAGNYVRAGTVRLDDSAAQLNPRYQFDGFVAGNGQSVCAGSRGSCSPAAFEGLQPAVSYMAASGMGKTHLLHAIGHEVKRLHAACG